MKYFLVKKRIRNIETVFTRSTWSEQNIDNFWPNLIWPTYLNPEQQADIVSKNRASLHNKVPFELKYHFQRYHLFAIERYKIKLITSRFPETILLATKRILCLHTRTYIFAHWIYYKMKHYQCSHTRDLKHNSSLLLLVIVIVINSLKWCSLEQCQVK